MNWISKLRPQVLAAIIGLVAIAIISLYIDVEVGKIIAGVCATGIVAMGTKLIESDTS